MDFLKLHICILICILCLSELIFPLFFLSSYKRFIPESLNRSIKQRSFMTRIRINNVFKKFLSEFHQRTIRDSNITTYDLKIKYLATLEGLTSGLGSEVFEPISLIVAQEGELFNGYYGKFSDQIIILYQCLEWVYININTIDHIQIKSTSSLSGKKPSEIVKQANFFTSLYYYYCG